MEELIEKMKVEGKDVNGKKLVEDGSMSTDTSRSRHTSEARSSGSNGPDPTEDGMSKYMGTHFWRSLSNEVNTTSFMCYRNQPRFIVQATDWVLRYRSKA